MSASPASRTPVVPPLESGDRLTQPVFRERYSQHLEIAKAELVEGVVYVASPTTFERHGRQHGLLASWLGLFAAATNGDVEMAPETTVVLDDENEPRPDVLLRRTASALSSLDENGYVIGPPELVAEVSATSVSFDMHQKLAAYRRNGVSEYLVWRVFDEQIDWFRLETGQYVRIDPGADGLMRSTVFPGLVLQPQAMLAGDATRVLATQLKSTPLA